MLYSHQYNKNLDLFFILEIQFLIIFNKLSTIEFYTIPFSFFIFYVYPCISFKQRLPLSLFQKGHILEVVPYRFHEYLKLICLFVCPFIVFFSLINFSKIIGPIATKFRCFKVDNTALIKKKSLYCTHIFNDETCKNL